MIDINFIGNCAYCFFSKDDKLAVFVLTFHPKLKKFTFEKKFSNLDCKSFNRFFCRCSDCVKAYYE